MPTSFCRSALVVTTLLATAPLLLLAGCKTTPEPITVTDEQSGQSVTLTEGAEFTIRLPSNRSTGYAWMLTNEVRPVLDPWTGPEYIMNPSGVIGQEGTTIFRFTAAQPGQTLVELGYRRAWEPNVAPAKQATYSVTVTPKQQ